MHDLMCKLYDRFKHLSLYKGIVYFFRGDVEARAYQTQQFLLSTYALHQRVFPQFKNKHNGQDVVLLACGPSAKDYQPLPNAITIGVNRAFRFERVKLDYLFVQDMRQGTREEIKAMNEYNSEGCVKFYGIESLCPGLNSGLVSESDAVSANAYRYYVDTCATVSEMEEHFKYDISTQPLSVFFTVVFPALQFALWTNPKRIFLVGCDCTVKGHFYAESRNYTLNTNAAMRGYAEFKRFAKAFYPETEIISVNPVGLKGVFRDWYQKSGPLSDII